LKSPVLRSEQKAGEKQLVPIVGGSNGKTIFLHTSNVAFIVAAIFITLTVCQSIQLANSPLFFSPPTAMRIVYLLFLFVCIIMPVTAVILFFPPFSAAFATVLLRRLLIFQFCDAATDATTPCEPANPFTCPGERGKSLTLLSLKTTQESSATKAKTRALAIVGELA